MLSRSVCWRSKRDACHAHRLINTEYGQPAGSVRLVVIGCEQAKAGLLSTERTVCTKSTLLESAAQWSAHLLHRPDSALVAVFCDPRHSAHGAPRIGCRPMRDLGGSARLLQISPRTAGHIDQSSLQYLTLAVVARLRKHSRQLRLGLGRPLVCVIKECCHSRGAQHAAEDVVHPKRFRPPTEAALDVLYGCPARASVVPRCYTTGKVPDSTSRRPPA